MSTTTYLQTATSCPRSHAISIAAPGQPSAFGTLGNPMFGTDVARVRDAKQAAPPRGELH